MATSLPVFEKFSVFSDEQSAGTRWRKWIERFENFVCALDVENDTRKKALLLYYCGEEVFDIYDSFTDEQKGKNATIERNDEVIPNEYATLKRSLTEYFTPKKNKAYETFRFRQATQREGETMDNFHTRLRTLAVNCEFVDTNQEILTQIMHGCQSQRLRRRALRDDFTLERILAEARAFELSEKRASEIEGAVNKLDINKSTSSNKSAHLNARSRHQQNYSSAASSNRHSSHHKKFPQSRNSTGSKFNQNSSYHSTNSKRESVQCRYCGGSFPHKSYCPAKGKECKICFKIGHFARVCQSSHKVRHVSHSKHVQDETVKANMNIDADTSSDESVFTLSNRQSYKSPVVSACIFDTQVKFLVDTGATVNILNSESLAKIKPGAKLRGPCPLIYAYGSEHPLPVKGYISADISFKQNTVNTKFYVIESSLRQKSSNLLSAETAQALNMIQLAFSAVPKSIHENFPSLFEGKMGKISDVKVKLHVDQDIQPVTQKHRRIPFHVRKDVEAELKRLEKMDIIEKVEGPTPWVSPTVIVPKKDGGVRLCIDMREPNKAIKREKHPMPTIDDLISDLNGATVFSKLDLSSAYHQLELDEASRYITTFTTHVGLRRYKRLLFGVNAAAEIFQNTISQMLNDISGVRNLSDDIIVYGKTQQDHDASLHDTLKRLEDRGAKLNKEKCQISVPELTFFGHVFSAEGIKPDPKKIHTIINSVAPTSVNEVRSFLGMTQYVARFIPDFASRTKPLRQLTMKNNPWKWSEQEQKAFDDIKKALTSTQVMSYFNPNKPTEIYVDASPVGLGAILTQENRVICYASRALTNTEQHYSQTDREMLAVVFGVEHFHLYLFGSKFTVITDHKPLLGIVKSQKPTTARIERLRLRLMPYEMNLQYRPGRDDLNPADYLSRYPQMRPKRENASEAYINYVSKNAVPKSMTLEEIETTTREDAEMRKLIKSIETGRWTNDLNEYMRFKDELSVSNGMILRGNRLIIPESLRKKVIDIAHASHQGIVKTKQLIREKVWFPGIDKMVEQTVKACNACLASVPRPVQQEPLSMTDLPSGPWVEIAVDFAGPFPSGDYLLVAVDEYSRFPEVDIISSISARTVIPHLDTMFARHGIPAVVKTDNGPPFNGSEFQKFSQDFGFKHRKVTPLWPQANGEAERFMGTLNKHVRTSVAENINWKNQLSQFLRLYRATPHSSTKISPFEALTGRKMRSGLPEAPQQSSTPSYISLHARMMRNDHNSKQKMKTYADTRRHTKTSDLIPGDTVLVKQPKTNKLTPLYDPKPYTVVKKKGSMVTARRGPQQIVRNSSFFRRCPNAIPLNLEEEEDDDDDDFQTSNRPTGTEAQNFNRPIPQHSQSFPSKIQQPVTQSTHPSPVNQTSPTDSYVNPMPVPQRPARIRKTPVHLKDFILK